MKILFTFLISLFLVTNAYAKTLVKYNKNTGDIIQTNTVDKMPSTDILADRFKSATTDALLYDGEVDISKQRVDLNTKGIIEIPKKELDDAKKIADEKQSEERLIQDRIRKTAIDQLKLEGVIFKHN